jgi:hypothetical protein
MHSVSEPSNRASIALGRDQSKRLSKVMITDLMVPLVAASVDSRPVSGPARLKRCVMVSSGWRHAQKRWCRRRSFPVHRVVQSVAIVDLDDWVPHLK